MKKIGVVVLMLLLLFGIAGCGEKNTMSSWEKEQLKRSEEQAKMLTTAHQNDDIDEALFLLFEYQDPSSSSSILKGMDVSGSSYSLAARHSFQQWFISKFSEITPTFSTGYYSNPINQKEDVDYTNSDNIRTREKWYFSGDFATSTTSSYDMDVHMYTRNLYRTYYFMGYAFEKDNATEEYYLSSIEEVLEKNDSSFYEYGEYVIYKKYAKSSNFIVINGERKTKEVHVAIDPHNPKFGPVAYID